MPVALLVKVVTVVPSENVPPLIVDARAVSYHMASPENRFGVSDDAQGRPWTSPPLLILSTMALPEYFVGSSEMS